MSSRRFVKHAIIRPVQERALGLDWYPATFVCSRLRICEDNDGHMRCTPRSPMLRVRAEWWRIIGFRLLWAWRTGSPWRDALSPTPRKD